jgi:glycolate oxidase
MDDATWETVKEKALHEMYTATYQHGGNLSGEHGIGAKRLVPLERFVDRAQIQVIKSIKAALDPNLILNPGKIVHMD